MKRFFLLVSFLSLFSFLVFAADTKTDSLMTAASINDVAKIKILLKEGVDVNSKDRENFTALMFAVVNNNIEAVNFLVSQKNIDINTRNTYGYSALTLAVIFGNTELIPILKKAGAKE